MAVTLTCPNCSSTLRAPENSAGKKVRCKKCEHKFRVPGTAAAGDSVAEDQALSVVEMPSPFGAKPAAVGAAAGGGGSFSFDEEEAVVKPPASGGRNKRSSMMMKNGKKGGDGGEGEKSNKGLIIALVAMVFVCLLGAGAAGAYFLLKSGKDTAQATDKGKDKDKDKKTGDTPADPGKIDGKKLLGRWEMVTTDKTVPPSFTEYTANGMMTTYTLSGNKASPLLSAAYKLDGNKLTVNLLGKDTTGTISKLADDEMIATDATGTAQTWKKFRKAVTIAKDSPSPKDPPNPKDPPPKDPPPFPKSGNGFPIPVVSATASKPVAKPQLDINLDATPDSVRAVITAGREPPVAMVMWNSFAGFQGQGGKDTVTRYSLAAKNEAGKFDVPALDWSAGARPFAASPDGNRAAVEGPVGKLTVYDFEEKVALLDKVDAFEAGSPQQIARIEFVDPGHLVVLDKAGAISVWDLKSKKRTAVAPAPAGAKGAPATCVSDGTLYVFHNGSLTAYKGPALSAGPSVKVAEATGAAALAVTVSPSGQKAAVVFKGETDPASAMVIVPIAGGGKSQMIVLPDAFGDTASIDWLGGVIALTSAKENRAASVLFDEEAMRPALYLKSGGGAVARQFPSASTSRLMWVVTPPNGVAAKSVLVGVSSGFDDYHKIAGPAIADRTPNGKPVFLGTAAAGLVSD